MRGLTLPGVVLAAAVNLSSAHAGTTGEERHQLDRLVMASERGLSLETILGLAEDAAEVVDLDADEAVLLLRAGVSPAIVGAVSRGAHPTAEDIAAAAEPGDAWTIAPGPAPPPVEPEEPAYVVVGPHYADGHPYWSYLDPQLLCSFSVLTDGRYTHVLVSAENVGAHPVTVFPASVNLTRLGSRTRLDRQEPSEFMRRQGNQATWRLVLGALLEPPVLQDQATAFAAVTTTGVAVAGAAVTTPSTEERIAAARYEEERRAQRVTAERARLAASEDFLLRAETLAPGEVVTGVVPFVHRAEPGDAFTVLFESAEDLVYLDMHTRR